MNIVNILKRRCIRASFPTDTVDEPTVEEAIQIIKGLRDRYEAHHRVRITDEAIEAAAKMSDSYISDRFLPNKRLT